MVVNFIIAIIIMAVGTWRASRYNHHWRLASTERDFLIKLLFFCPILKKEPSKKPERGGWINFNHNVPPPPSK